MANAFMELKRSRDKQASRLTEEFKKVSNPAGSKKEDDRFWSPTVDKTGNGYAVIRFLPAPKNEDVPFIRIFSHGFKGPTGSWYIENSLSTIGQPDPVGEYNQKLWNSGIEADKEIVRLQKRRLHFIANVLIIKDPANPENEGQVKLFKFGKKIFDKLNDLANPQFQDEKPINPFDMWEGANFKLKIRTVEGYRNYDKSEFDTPSPISDDDDKMAKIWEAEHSLATFLDPKNFDTYDSLKAKMERVLGIKEASGPARKSEAPVAEAPQMKTAAPKQQATSVDDEEDFDSIFKNLQDE